MNPANNTFNLSVSLNRAMNVNDATRQDALTPPAQNAAPAPALQLNGDVQPQEIVPAVPEIPAPLSANALPGWNPEEIGNAPAAQLVHIIQEQILQTQWNFALHQMNPDQTIENLKEKVNYLMMERIQTLREMQKVNWRAEEERLRMQIEMEKVKMDSVKAMIQKEEELVKLSEFLRQKDCHEKEMNEVKIKLEQENARHVAEVEELKKEAARDLAKIERMRKDAEESARLQKDQKEEHKKKEAKLLKDNANLQKQNDDLISKQNYFRSVMSGTVKFLNKGADAPPASEAINGIIEKGKTDIMKEIKRETNDSRQKRAADSNISPIEKKKINMGVNEDSD